MISSHRQPRRFLNWLIPISQRPRCANATPAKSLKIAKQNESAPWAHNLAGIILSHQHKTEEAIAEYQKAIKLDPHPTSPTEGVGRRQAAEILGMQLQRSALQGMSAQSTSRLFRVVIFGGG